MLETESGLCYGPAVCAVALQNLRHGVLSFRPTLL
jgi:hypothetical protein